MDTFEIENIEFRFDKENPYYLEYKIVGNYYEGKLTREEIESLIINLKITLPQIKEKIHYKGIDFTRDEIWELYQKLNPLKRTYDNEVDVPF